MWLTLLTEREDWLVSGELTVVGHPLVFAGRGSALLVKRSRPRVVMLSLAGDLAVA